MVPARTINTGSGIFLSFSCAPSTAKAIAHGHPIDQRTACQDDHGTRDCTDGRGRHSLHKCFHLWVTGKSPVIRSSQDDDQEWRRKDCAQPPRLRRPALPRGIR